MTESEAAFVESMGQFMGTQGMPPMAGRMWGWLLICEPAEQTAADLAEALRASRGAISGAARLLETAALIRRTTRRGDRREYFSVPAGAVNALVEEAGTPLRRLRELMDDGLGILAARPPEVRARLQAVHDTFSFFEREWPALVERFRSERAGATASHPQSVAEADRISA